MTHERSAFNGPLSNNAESVNQCPRPRQSFDPLVYPPAVRTGLSMQDIVPTSSRIILEGTSELFSDRACSARAIPEFRSVRLGRIAVSSTRPVWRGIDVGKNDIRFRSTQVPGPVSGREARISRSFRAWSRILCETPHSIHLIAVASGSSTLATTTLVRILHTA